MNSDTNTHTNHSNKNNSNINTVMNKQGDNEASLTNAPDTQTPDTKTPQATSDATDQPKSPIPTQAISDQTVLITGGGQVGLSFALLLANKGIASTLLEKNRYPKISPDDDVGRKQYLDSRNIALSRRTVQIYQEIGLWQQLQSHACRIDSVQVSEQGSFGYAELNKEEENVESFGQVMESAWLGRKLLLAVQDNPLITLIDGAVVTAVEQSATEVTLVYDIKSDPNSDSGSATNAETAPNVDSEKNLTASMLVACDGQHSTVRKLLGIGTSSYDYGQTAIVGVVQTDTPHRHVAIERFSPAGPLAVLPLTDPNGDGNNPVQDGYRRSVVWVCKHGEEQQYIADDDLYLSTMQRAFGHRAGKFVKAGRRGAYPLTRVLAERQVEGRVVIMGNAAHTLHPVAGQGFNLCMRDAHVLAKMLSHQVLRGEDIGDAQLLKRYETARLKDQKRVIRFCDAIVHGFSNTNPVIKLARNMALKAFDKTPGLKPLVASYAMGLKS